MVRTYISKSTIPISLIVVSNESYLKIIPKSIFWPFIYTVWQHDNYFKLSRYLSKYSLKSFIRSYSNFFLVTRQFSITCHRSTHLGKMALILSEYNYKMFHRNTALDRDWHHRWQICPWFQNNICFIPLP